MKFVVLKHTTAEQCWHFDFMLDSGNALKTWAIPQLDDIWNSWKTLASDCSRTPCPGQVVESVRDDWGQQPAVDQNASIKKDVFYWRNATIGENGVNWNNAFNKKDDEKPSWFRIDSIVKLLPDHRRHYLNYEGEISKNRGWVSQWDCGTFVWLENEYAKKVVRLFGRKLNGIIMLTPWLPCFPQKDLIAQKSCLPLKKDKEKNVFSTKSTSCEENNLSWAFSWIPIKIS